MSRKRAFRKHAAGPRPQKHGQPVMGTADMRKAKSERKGLIRLITRMLNRDTLERLEVFGIEGSAKRTKRRLHNTAMKRAWRQMQRSKGQYGQSEPNIPAPKLVYDSGQGPAARSRNIETNQVTYVPWRTIAK